MRAENVNEVSVDEAVQHMVNNLPGAKLVDWTSAESTLLPKKADTGKKKMRTTPRDHVVKFYAKMSFI